MHIPLDETKSFDFQGEMISEAIGRADHIDPFEEDIEDLWSELRLYTTQDGRYVCEQVRCESWKGGHEKHQMTICDSATRIKEFFGTSGLAEELYVDADLFYAEDAG
jgi:hypothetical protein